jgi:phosphoribosylglycinamide formyltransferase-1
VTPPPPLRLVILISGRGSNMAAIARDCLEGRVAARVELVVADRPTAAGIGVARDLGIATAVVPFAAHADRTAFERDLRERIDAARPGLVVLAGFMRILSPEFVSHYAGRMVNIHPSLLPRHRGLHTHRRALEERDSHHGASVHFVTAELDGGPVVLQSRLAVRPGETEAALSARVQRTEHIIYPRAIGWLAAGRLTWRDGRPWLDGAPLAAPLVEEFVEDRS